MKQTRPTTPTLLTFNRMLDLIFGENWRAEVPAREDQERLREKLDTARTKLLARMHEFEKEAGTDKMTESDFKQIYDNYRAEIDQLNKLIERLNKLIEVKDEITEIKDKQISEYKKIIEVQEKQIYMQEQHILNLKYLLNAGK